MKKIVLFFILIGFALPSFAAHLKGGWIQYEYLGSGNTANTTKYKITVHQYLLCTSTAAQIDQSVYLGIFDGATNTTYQTVTIPLSSTDNLNNNSSNSCITGDNNVCYRVDNYVTTIDLPENTGGYILAVQRCCRVAGIINIQNSSNAGITYFNAIPGVINGISYRNNSSPVFIPGDSAIVCFNGSFNLNFGATDADGDSLVYSFCDGFIGGDSSPTGSRPNPPSNPPYSTVTYSSGYSGSQPMGSTVNINSTTGLISGTAPGTVGDYVVAVCVTEYRNGVIINVAKKEIHVKVANCQAAKPDPGPDDKTCNGFTFSFSNNTTAAFTAYTWSFGDGTTSNQPTPTHTYTDTGVYKVQLKGATAGGCQDSAFKLVYVFPGFVPNFNVLDNCFQSPIRFQDATTTAYGVVNSWSWDFGDLTTQADTSHLKNPSYLYPAANTYTIQLIATNSKGCIDTIVKPWNVLDKPNITLPFHDTLICSIDTLQLIANTTGSINWTPNYNIINPTSANPLVYPKFTTTYTITVNNSGCINRDSIKVNVLNFITVDAGRDTTICLTDTLRLQPISQALSFLWSSSTGEMVQPTKFPLVKPLVQTIYKVTANLGKCQDKDSVIIKVAPYPLANAGADKTICFGDNVQLNGSYQGAFFTWSPTTFLANGNTLTPTASPRSTINYILTANDTVGCPKPVRDTVQVVVIPKVKAFAGRDTTIVANQPLQLNASGAANYAWSPITGLNNPSIANPIAILGTSVDSIRYIVTVSTPEGCNAIDDIVVKVFKTGPEIFVPSGFTPNGDFKNDILKPILVGMKALNYFRVYNRWGQLLFQTSEIGKGWDGTISGTPQQSGTFVYMAEAVDYLGNTVFRKGTVVLIR